MLTNKQECGIIQSQGKTPDIDEEGTTTMNRTDFGKRVFQEFNFHHWIEIRKGQVFYMYFIMDEKRNTLLRSKFYDDMDECLEAARNRLDEMI